MNDVECMEGYYCFNSICISDECAIPKTPCARGYSCNNGHCVKEQRNECEKDSDCEGRGYCSSDYTCKAPTEISCKNDADCANHIAECDCQKQDDTCMAGGLCAPNVCSDDNDCYAGFFCFKG